VVGAGIFGVTAALELRRRGWRVRLVDRWSPGSPAPHPRASTTDVSKVVRMDYGTDRFTTELAAEAMAGWDEWNRRFGRPLFHRVGFLLLTRSPFAEGGFEAGSYRTLRDLGRPVERIGPEALAARFPAWRPGRYRDGYLNPEAGWAESGAVAEHLLDWAAEAGVEWLAGTVTAVESRGQGARLEVSTADGARRLEGDAVILAAGAWSDTLLPELAGQVAPRAMPVVHLRPRDPEPFRPERFPVWGADIGRTGWYGFPLHPDGFVKIGHHGAGWADDPDRADTLPSGFEPRLRDFLADSLPGLADAEIVTRRVCFYTDSRDGTFRIGRVPGAPGIVVATGGSGHGFKFGPLLGPLIANAVEGVADERLGRFRWRDDASPAREEARAEISP
jgi:glycine/D-amino acid oxidase-like deaminating enzyme